MAEQVTSAKATAKTVRIPARKARLVIDLIRGKSVAEAFGILKFTPRSGAYLIEKVLKSAVANAENNFDLDVEDLYVSEAFVIRHHFLCNRKHPRIGNNQRIRSDCL